MIILLGLISSVWNISYRDFVIGVAAVCPSLGLFSLPVDDPSGGGPPLATPNLARLS